MRNDIISKWTVTVLTILSLLMTLSILFP